MIVLVILVVAVGIAMVMTITITAKVLSRIIKTTRNTIVTVLL